MWIYVCVLLIGIGSMYLAIRYIVDAHIFPGSFLVIPFRSVLNIDIIYMTIIFTKITEEYFSVGRYHCLFS